MDTKILKHILNYDFYSTNKHKLSPQLFEDEVRELYEVTVDAHSKYQKTLDTDDLLGLWKVQNPVAVRAKVSVIEDLINAIKNDTLYVEEVAEEILQKLWQREHGRKVAELGIAISEGKSSAIHDLKVLLEQSKDGFQPDDFGPDTTKDLEELLELTGEDNRFRFNILALSRHVYGLGKGEFATFFARPNVGKSSFAVSLSCAEGGFCHQGAKVFMGCNEELSKRTMLRCYQAVSKMSEDDIIKNPTAAIEAFDKIKDNLVLKDIQDWTIETLDAYLSKNEFDVVIVDQLDKLSIGNSSLEGWARLGEIYLQSREIAKRHDCVMIGICQASNDAQDKTILDFSMMAGSKTNKAAESDLIIGIGKLPNNPDGTPEPLRFLTVCKNKLKGGYHGTVNAMLDAHTSIYSD
jgi:hypothetical protein